MLRISQDCVILIKLFISKIELDEKHLSILIVISYIIYYLENPFFDAIYIWRMYCSFTTLYKVSVLLNAIYGNMRLLFSLQKWLNHIKGYTHIGLNNVIFLDVLWCHKNMINWGVIVYSPKQLIKRILTWEETSQEFVLPYFTNLQVSIVETLLLYEIIFSYTETYFW